MSATRDPDQILNAWLEEGPTTLPAPTVRAIEVATRATAQRRPAIRPPWRRNPMPFNYKFLGAAAALAIVLVGGAMLLGPRSDQGTVGGSSPSPSPTSPASPAAPTQSPLSDAPTFNPASGWTTYTSSQYGFSVSHPDDWDVDPADRAWDLDTDAADWLSPAMDDFTAPTGDVRVSVWSVPVDPDAFGWDMTKVEAWIEEYCQKTGSRSCAGILEQTVPLCVEVRDCHPGAVVLSPDREVQAFFAGGIYAGRMVVVTIWGGEADPSLSPYGGGRQLMDAFLAPMCVWREDARPEPPPACLNAG